MWQLLFWGSIALILYSYVGYPALLYIISRSRRRQNERVDSVDAPTVCLIISAFNEEKVIRRKIENSLELDYPRDRLTILVASDGSTDETVAIAKEYSSAGVEVIHRTVRRGKSAVLNDVVPQLDADIVVFTDANAVFDPAAVTNLVARFADPNIGCVVGKLRYVEESATAVGRGEGAYWRYEARISEMESELQRVLVANGSIFAIRRGLFPELFAEVANDFQVPIEIAGAGYGVVYEPSALAVEHTSTYWHEEFGRKVRIIIRGLTGFTRLRSVMRGLQRWQFVSHKLVRWFVGVLLLLALTSNAMLAGSSGFYTFTMFAQLLFYAAAVAGWLTHATGRPNRILYIPFYFTMVNVAALAAVMRFASGDRLSVWDKAESTRLVAVPPSTPEADESSAPSGEVEETERTAEVAKR